MLYRELSRYKKKNVKFDSKPLQRNFNFQLFNKYINAISSERQLTTLDFLRSYSAFPEIRNSVDFVKDSIIGLKWEIRDKNGEDVKDDEKFKVFSKPNELQTRSEFIETLVKHYMLAGFYIYETDKPASIFREYERFNIKGMLPLSVQDISLELDGAGFPLIFKEGNRIAFNEQKVVYSMDSDPENFRLPVPRFKSAEKAMISLGFISQFINKYFEKNTHLGTYFTTDQTLSDITYERLQADLANKAGWENAFEGKVFDAGLEVATVDLKTPLESGFKDTIKAYRDEIIIASLVPKALIDTADVTFTNQKQAEKIAYQKVIIPLSRKLSEKFTELLPDGYEYIFDFEDVSALKEDDSKKKHAISRDYKAGILTQSEAREMGYNIFDAKGEDKFTEKTSGETISDKIEKSLSTYFSIKKGTTEKSRRSEYAKLDELHQKIESSGLKEVQSVYSDFLKKAQETIESYDVINAANKAAILLTLEKLVAAYASVLRLPVKNLLEKGLENGYKFFTRKYSTGKTFNVGSKRFSSYVSDRLNFLENSTSKTLSLDMQKTIEKAIELNLTPKEASDRLAKFYDAKYKASRTAQTEISSAMNKGLFESGKDGNFKYKQWISRHDERTRDTHADMDGEIRRMDEVFSNGLMYPHYSGAPASEVINCRCYLSIINLG